MTHRMSRSTRYLKDDVADLLLDTLGTVLGESLLDVAVGTAELLDLLRSTAGEGGRVEEAVELGVDGLEEFGDADALDQVVVLAFELDGGGGLVGEDADFLVGILAGDALLDESHDDVFAVKG